MSHLPLIEFGRRARRRWRASRDRAAARRSWATGYLCANDHLHFSRPWLDGPTALAATLDAADGMSLRRPSACRSSAGRSRRPSSSARSHELSDGRLVAGVGPGSSPRDYARDRRRRSRSAGARFDDGGPRAARALRSERSPDADASGPPLWLASWGSPAGLRRVARLGDGWLASGYNTPPERFGEGAELLARERPDPLPNGVATMWLYVTERSPRRRPRPHRRARAAGRAAGRDAARARAPDRLGRAVRGADRRLPRCGRRARVRLAAGGRPRASSSGSPRRSSRGSARCSVPDVATTERPEAEESVDRSPRVANRAAFTKPAEISSYEIVNHYFELAADLLGLADDLAAVLRSSYREVQVQIPVRRRDGKIHVYSGYRVQHNGARGPYKGGVRYHPDVELDEVRALADAHDVEDGDRRRAVRRREGRRELPAGPRARRARDGHALVHPEDRPRHRADARHPRAGRQHERPGDGLDDGRVRQAPRPLAGDRDRQADRARRLARPRGGDRPRRSSTCCARRRRTSASTSPRCASAIQGFGNVGSWAGADPPRARGEDRRGPGPVRRDPQRRRHRRRGADDAPARRQPHRGVRRRRGGPGPRVPGDADATSSSRRRSAACSTATTPTCSTRRCIIEGANSPTTPKADDILDDPGVLDRSPTSWPTRAASSSRTSSGCRTSSTSAGTSARSTTSSARSCAAPTARSTRAPRRTTCRCAIAAYEIGIERVVEAARTRGYI